MNLSKIRIITITLFTLLLMGCSLNSLKYGSNLKEGQALINPISETIYTPTSSKEVDLKIISINGKSTSLFSLIDTQVVNTGEIEFLVRCYYNYRKSFTTFKLNLESKKVYHIRANVSNKETVFNVYSESKIVASQSAETKIMNSDRVVF